MHVSALAVHPVKSSASVAVSEAVVERWGLVHDRRWMVVDPTGTTVTARTHRRLLHVTGRPRDDGGLRLSAPGLPPLDVPVPRGPASRTLTMSRIAAAVPAGPAADDWLSRHLRESVQLVWLDDPGRRTVGVTHGGQDGDVLAFADAGPVLLTSTASLARLNDWVAQTARARHEAAPPPLPMARFRPNIVVDGLDDPFTEDGWTGVTIGEVEMRLGEHCDRCVLTTIDPVSLRSTKEPLRTLALHRQWDHRVHFGIRLIPVSTGVVRVGDAVTVRTSSTQERATVG